MQFVVCKPLTWHLLCTLCFLNSALWDARIIVGLKKLKGTRLISLYNLSHHLTLTSKKLTVYKDLHLFWGNHHQLHQNPISFLLKSIQHLHGNLVYQHPVQMCSTGGDVNVLVHLILAGVILSTYQNLDASIYIVFRLQMIQGSSYLDFAIWDKL